MIERFIHHVRVERPDTAETAAEARERLREKFPRGAVRRMTHLGMLLGSALEEVSLATDDAIVYASTFAETRALEDFLASFPTPSPLLFQTSIHPGAVQQVLIARQQPVARLWPIASRTRLVEQALLTALIEPAARVALVGGEERGTWMLENNMASERAFAFAIVLTGEAAGAIGRIAMTPLAQEAAGICPPLDSFVDALVERRSLAWRGAGGTLTLDWQ
jgi:hypothetical protein